MYFSGKYNSKTCKQYGAYRINQSLLPFVNYNLSVICTATFCLGSQPGTIHISDEIPPACLAHDPPLRPRGSARRRHRTGSVAAQPEVRPDGLPVRLPTRDEHEAGLLRPPGGRGGLPRGGHDVPGGPLPAPGGAQEAHPPREGEDHLCSDVGGGRRCLRQGRRLCGPRWVGIMFHMPRLGPVNKTSIL